MYIYNDSKNCRFIRKKSEMETILKHMLLKNVGEF